VREEQPMIQLDQISVSPFSGNDVPALADLSRCVHCGLCLSSCPTFVATGLEAESPRGRIYLIRAADEGRVPLDETFASHMELCLQCRNCEAVCPSGVPFGRIMEATRAQLLTQKTGPRAPRLLRTAITRALFPHKRVIAAAARSLGFYQRRVRPALLKTHILAALPRALRELEAMAPPIAARPFAPKQQRFAARKQQQGRVAMFSGCVMPYMYPETETATLDVLRRGGYDVALPHEQGCCGALLIHGGDREPARALARRNIDIFLASGAEAVIVNAAGCGSTLKEYGELLAHDPAYREKAERFSALVKDVTEFVAAHPPAPGELGEVRARVSYQDSCHLAHAQRVKDAPRALIRAIPGVDFVELGSDRCCGSAGIYNVVQPEMSAQVLDSKMDEVDEARPDILVTANPGCMLQLENGVRGRGSDVRVMHVVDLLAASFKSADERSRPPA
jgi:glycolate oxidase iron-sulfur subunit